MKHPLNVDFAAVVKSLIDKGYTQQKLATECYCSLPTINRLATGKNNDPQYSVGAGLLQLIELKRVVK